MSLGEAALGEEGPGGPLPGKPRGAWLPRRAFLAAGAGLAGLPGWQQELFFRRRNTCLCFCSPEPSCPGKAVEPCGAVRCRAAASARTCSSCLFLLFLLLPSAALWRRLPSSSPAPGGSLPAPPTFVTPCCLPRQPELMGGGLACGTAACCGAGSVLGSVALGLVRQLLGAGGGGQLRLWHPSQSHCLLANHLPKTAGLAPVTCNLDFFFHHNLLNSLDLFCKGLPFPTASVCASRAFVTLLLPPARAQISPERLGPLFPLGEIPCRAGSLCSLQCTEVFCKLCRRN